MFLLKINFISLRRQNYDNSTGEFIVLQLFAVLSITVLNRFFRFYRSFGGMDPSLSSFGAEGVPPNPTRNNLPAQKPIHGNSSNTNSEKTSKPVAAIKPVVKSVKPQVQKERSNKFKTKLKSGNRCWLGRHPWKTESLLEKVHFTQHLINSTIIKLIFERTKV